MSRWQRTGAAILCLALVLASGWWLARRLVGRPEPPSPATATPTNPSPSVPTAPPLQAPRGYRLAGVAVGEPASFAVVEAPSGANVLYRVDADIPGLGRLVRIEAERIVVQSDAGQIELWLMPAASPTPTRVRAATARAATAVARTALPTVPPPTPKRPPAGGASTPGSTPSGAPGSPVS
jgi:hypothetical protein